MHTFELRVVCGVLSFVLLAKAQHMSSIEQVSDVVLTVQGDVMTVGAAIETVVGAVEEMDKNLLLSTDSEVPFPIISVGKSIGLCLKPYI